MTTISQQPQAEAAELRHARQWLQPARGVASCDAFPPWLASSQASQQNRNEALAWTRPAVSTARTTCAQIIPGDAHQLAIGGKP